MTDPKENDSIPEEGRQTLSGNNLENVVVGVVRGRAFNEYGDQHGWRAWQLENYHFLPM
ncbi:MULTISPECIES: hypothetical protein [unclassified Prochlorococcus]|uniref:hypothetical protein n=1 Tax=unclassified Prochlorococcus TaxID=2627481 RepID=UPI0005338CFC|nr:MULTISPECIES: hypothetical protein [unclassified Prochlorococcus]KGG25091.1 hypothetical protein EV12_2971 [Prochlorococcus sp. MIT 0701]KGG26243.1 hypothetical protein EV13_3026 [Prochlorococcus sp. MIT 0702]KGG33067.1 hypothetical protein EV14_1908 [Prochlorococcus sp. MIT 0703]